MTDDEINDLIDSKIRVHDNDDRAHGLALLRQQLDLTESKTGMWSVKAADNFSGPNGSPLGNAQVGGQPWQSNGLVRSGGRIVQPSGGSGGAWLNTGNSDGQVEADLYPGSHEASIYFRINAALNQFFLFQRANDGGLTLNIIFGGQTTRIAPLKAEPVQAGERYKVRLIGPRIWVLRVFAGVEELLFDVEDSRLVNETIHGIRLDGGGTAGNFRVLQREAI